MRIGLRVAALFVALVTVALWFFGGFNLGRTQTTVPVEYPASGDGGASQVVHETRFLPGLDFLGAGFALSAIVYGASCLIRRPTLIPVRD